MSNTRNEISYRIFNYIKPKISDDESIDISEIKYDVDNTRAMLIKQRFSNKFRETIPEQLTQSIPKVAIENVNASNLMPDVPSDKVLMRTKLEIPNFLTKSSGIPMIKRISASTVLSHNFSIVTAEQAITSGNGKFNQKNIFCFYENGYLYLLTGRILNKGLKYIDLNAVFEEPNEANDYLNTNNGTSLDDDSPYPLSLDMVNDLENIIIKKLFREAQQPIDSINDSSDTQKQLTS